MTMVLGPDRKAQAAAERAKRQAQAEARGESPARSEARSARPTTAPTPTLRTRRLERRGADRPAPTDAATEPTPDADRADARQRHRRRRGPAGPAGPAERRLGGTSPAGPPPDQTGHAMPKMKTHRGAAKRFKITGTGKLRRRQINMNHILEKKPPARKRRLRTRDRPGRPATRPASTGCSVGADAAPTPPLPRSTKGAPHGPGEAIRPRQEEAPCHPRARQGLLRQQEPVPSRRQRAGDAQPAVRLPRPPRPQGRLPPAVDPAHQRRLPPERHELQPRSWPACASPASRSTARSSPTWPSPTRPPSRALAETAAKALEDAEPACQRRPDRSSMAEPIGARHHSLQRLRRLSRRRSARTGEGAFVIDGPTLLAEALDAGVVVDGGRGRARLPRGPARRAAAAGATVHRAARARSPGPSTP